MKTHECDILIVGAGPAGMVTACLLARNGVNVLIIERNDNFDREFRGEALQPRFHKAMEQVGLFEHIKKYPHEETKYVHLALLLLQYFSEKPAQALSKQLRQILAQAQRSHLGYHHQQK